MITVKLVKDREKISELSKEVKLKEEVDYEADFIGLYKDDKLIGVAGVTFNTKKYPQFEHIWMLPKGTKLLIKLMNAMEEHVYLKGFNLYVSHISDNFMQGLAMKWGMIPYAKDEQGDWFYKTIS